VAIAYPAPPKAMLAKFTSQTGVKVNWSYLQWDDLQTKIAAAGGGRHLLRRRYGRGLVQGG